MTAILAPTASSIAGILDRSIHYFALGAEATFAPWNRLSRSAEEPARFGPGLERREASALYPVEVGNP